MTTLDAWFEKYPDSSRERSGPMSNTTAVDRIAKIIAGPLLPVGEGDMALAAEIVAAEIKPLTDAAEMLCDDGIECYRTNGSLMEGWSAVRVMDQQKLRASLDRVRTPTERSANDGR